MFQSVAVCAGRAREPFSALLRAHWVILTRAEVGEAAVWQERIQALHPCPRVLHCSTTLAGLAEAGSGRLEPQENLRSKKVAAFCGIGNPAAFFADLRLWGFEVAAESVFRDHHLYSRQDLKRLSALAQLAGADAFLTTEKDLMNLPPGWNAPLPLSACCIRMEIEEKMEFEPALLAALEAAGRAN